jgi:hypothetical protein
MITSIRLRSIRRRNRAEFVAVMQPVGDNGPPANPGQFAGERISERFSRPEAHRGYLMDSDLVPQYQNQHRGSARYVARKMVLGHAGVFTVEQDGFFRDYHGGTGLQRGSDLQWFTPQALARGIGWYFVQTYFYNNRAVGRFKIIRIFSTQGGGRVEVIKLPLR